MEKKKTKKKTKWKEIRSAVTMMCVMAAMMSTATYAWFTLTSSPTVTGMQMTATSQGGLLVATENVDASYKNAISLATENNNVKELKPVTPSIVDTNKQGFRAPVYTGGTVTGLGDLVTDVEGYVATYKFWIKAEGTETVDVGIIGGSYDQTDLTLNNGTPKASGTVVHHTSGKDANGAYAIRIGLLPDGTNFENMIIIEPNADGTFSTKTTAPTENNMNQIESTFSSDVKLNKSGVLTDTTTNISGKLFEASPTAKEVTMYIWLEGTDAECANEIMADELAAQIQFTIVEDTVTEP